MLSRDQIALIHQEIDGANTPEGSAAFRSLMEQDPEARALAAELRQVAGLFDQAGEREPPPQLSRAILDALPQPARASPGTEAAWMTPRTIIGWTVGRLRLLTERMEEAIMTKKTMLIGGTAVAIVIVIAGILTGFPPGSREAGTIGGVEQAARYHGRAMTEADVTLKNPEIQALFQNDKILSLVKSDAFREVMNNQAYRLILAGDAYRLILNNPAYQQLMASPAYQQLMASQAYQQLAASQAFRDMQANQAYQKVMASQAYQQLMASQAFRDLEARGAFREAQSAEAMHALQADQAFRDLQANQAFQRLRANQAFQQLQASEAFHSLAQSQALSQAFMQEAMRSKL